MTLTKIAGDCCHFTDAPSARKPTGRRDRDTHANSPTNGGVSGHLRQHEGVEPTHAQSPIDWRFLREASRGPGQATAMAPHGSILRGHDEEVGRKFQGIEIEALAYMGTSNRATTTSGKLPVPC